MEKKNKFPTILLLEDDQSVREILETGIKREKYLVISASDGEKGLKLALSKKPDLIVVDVILPKLQGIKVIEKVREAGEWGKQVPVIFLSNLDYSKKMMKTKELGKCHYLVKVDTEIKDLLKLIKKETK